MKHHALEELDECLALLGCDRSRMAGRSPEGRLIRRQPIVSSLTGFPSESAPTSRKSRKFVTRTWRYSFQYFDTWALSAVRSIVAGGFASTTPAGPCARHVAPQCFLELVGGEKGDVRNSSLLAWVHYTSDLGLQGYADGIEQFGERRII